MCTFTASARPRAGAVSFGGWQMNEAANCEAALRRHPDVAGPTMKVGAVLGLHSLEASRDKINSWHPSVFELRQAGHTSAGGRTRDRTLDLSRVKGTLSR
jgi:hypothetical protein